jgi:alpha/beta hydrolase fold
MRDNQKSNATRDTTFSRRDMLWAAGALTVSAAFEAPSDAAAAELGGARREPASWVDPAMPEVTHRMIDANGIRLHVAEQGEGPLVILCHGFPECWYSWRHQLPALAKAGFRAVAPDLRGYGRSDRPEEVESRTAWACRWHSIHAGRRFGRHRHGSRRWGDAIQGRGARDLDFCTNLDGR